jgi:protein O-mannosyl-transferase
MRRLAGRPGSAPATTPVWLRPAPVILLLAALTILIYLNSLPNEFVFDDLGLIAKKQSIRNLWNIPSFLGLHGDVAYRPLRTISHAVDYALFGLNPAGFRAVNIALHILNSALVFSLFQTLLRNPRPALVAAVLFAVHPIQTESVAYISGRRDLLFSLFYLLGFASYIRYRDTDRPRYLALAGVGYLLSLLSKEMGITLPVLCVGYDVIRSMPAEGITAAPAWQALAEGARAAIRRNSRLYAVAAGALLSLVLYYAFVANPSQQREMYGGGLWPTLLTGARIFAHYLKLLVFPLTLNADYSYNAFPISYSATEPRIIFAVIILGVTWWGLYRLLSLDRWAAFGGLWFFVTLLPVSQIIPHHEIVAEHYLYLPSAGVFLVVGALLERVLARQRRQAAIMAAFVAIVVLFGIRTAVRNRDWRDSETLWTKTIQTAPESARAHTNVGEIALRKGRFQQAYQEFSTALEIKPNDAVNHDNLAVVLLRHGQFDEAERHLRASLQIQPDYPKAHVNLGLIFLNRRQLDEAAQEFDIALSSQRITPGFRAEILTNRGIVAALKGKLDEAEQMFADAVRIAPDSADAHANLGKAYLEKGMIQEAIARLAEAVKLRESDPRFHYLLGEAYHRQGQKELALLEVAKALSLRTDFPEARALRQKIGEERPSERGKRG